MPETKSRPFHETIVDLIRRTGQRDVPLISEFIADNQIPAGHDAIIAAVETNWSFSDCYLFAKRVREHVLRQKHETETKAADQKKAEEEKAAAEVGKDRLLDEAEISMTEVLDYFTNSSRPPMDIALKIQRARNGLSILRGRSNRALHSF